MEVRFGAEPRHQDDDVRFRVTYFYRVFDYCAMPGEKEADAKSIKSDSLYRFRMTGKANSLFTKVVFESGTLKAYEIDPLGANVAFDKKNGRFYFQSRAETERDAKCAAVEADMERLTARLRAVSMLSKDDSESYANLVAGLKARIAALTTSNVCLPKDVSASLPPQTGGGLAVRKAASALKGLDGALKDVEVKEAATTLYKLALAAISGGGFASASKELEKAKGDNVVDDVLRDAGEQLIAVSSALRAVTQTIDATKLSAEVQKRLTDAHVPASVAVASAGAALMEAANQPISASLLLSISGDRLIEAGAVFKGLAGFIGTPTNVLNPAPAGFDTKTEAATLTAIAGEFADAGGALKEAASASGSTSAGCSPGENIQRGFQLVGPQAVTTFNPED